MALTGVVSGINNVIPENSVLGKKAAEADFSGILSKLLNQVETSQQKADVMAEKLITGNVEDLHQVTLAMEQAKLTLQLAVQVRNKIVDAYQEIMRMQV